MLSRFFSSFSNLRSSWPAIALIAPLLMLSFAAQSHAAVTSVTPSAWNIIGLDSNSPAFGPSRFPVGTVVCSAAADTVTVDFNWDTGGTTTDDTYIKLRGASSIDLDFSAAGCKDAFFEAEVTKTAAAFNQTRRYHIEATGSSGPTLSTPTPRELFVEYLISQNRNSISDVVLDGNSIPAGGTMNLIVGNTYTIELHGGTATQGYNQFEAFINFPNTIFQILSVSTTYSANSSPFIPSPHAALYADSCLWENDPDSPYYQSCFADYKTGGNDVVTTYVVKIISGGGTSETLNTLLYDFSGSSFHYNADYSFGARYATITDPSDIGIAKQFAPNPIASGGTSVLTFTLSNPNGADISDVSFVDTFPTSPGAMTVYNVTTISNGCGGNLFDDGGGTLEIGDPGIKYNAATIPAYSSCSIKVSVTAPGEGDYVNTTGHLYSGAIDTSRTATDTLTVDDNTVVPPVPPSSCASPTVLATWDFSGGAPLDPTTQDTDVSSASASFNGTNSISTSQGNPVNSWQGSGWATSSPATATPYYQFDLDSSNYGGVSISFDYLMVNGDWASIGDNYLLIDSDDDGNGYTNIVDANFAKGSWTTVGPYPAAVTGTNATAFQIRAYGAKSGKPLYLDNVSVTGCPVLDLDPPTITKSFSPDPVAVNQVSTLTFTITNPNGSNALTGVAFSDTFPTGMEIAPTPNASTSGCDNTSTPTFAPTAGASSIAFSTGSIATAGTCTVSVDVIATTAGTFENTSGFVSASESGSNNGASGYATDTLTALDPPVISKSFSPESILIGDASTLTLTIDNPNQDNALSGVSFTDTFPTSPDNMTVYNVTTISNDCGGTLFGDSGSPQIGDGSIGVSGVTLAGGGSCSISVEVTAATASGTPYDNTTGAVSHVINGDTINGNTASASLGVNPPNPPELLKQVGPSSIGPWSSYMAVLSGGAVYYRFTVENTGDDPMTIVSINDALISTSSCSWPILAVNDGFDNEHIASCVVGPISAVAGSHPNTASATGTYDGSTNYTSRNSTATYETTSLGLVKSVAEPSFTTAGTDLHYSYLVTNSGVDILAGPVVVTDNKITSVSCPNLITVGNNDSNLDPGESITCTATYTTTSADASAGKITNAARATVDGVNSPTVSKTILSGNLPSLLFLKTVETFSDPINGSTNQKAIPGAYMDYTLLVSNTGVGSVDEDTLVITDPIPANSQLFVGELDIDQGVLVQFSDADSDSGFSLTANPSAPPTYLVPFTVGYFTDASCTTAAGALVPDSDGFVANVRCLRINMDGIMNGTSDPADPADFSLKFRVRID